MEVSCKEVVGYVGVAGNMEYGIWNMEYGIWNMEYGIFVYFIFF